MGARDERAREARPDLKLLFMSGYADNQATRIDRALERILAKPFTRAALLTKVRETLDAA